MCHEWCRNECRWSARSGRRMAYCKYGWHQFPTKAAGSGAADSSPPAAGTSSEESASTTEETLIKALKRKVVEHMNQLDKEELDDSERRKKIGRISRAFHPDKSPGGHFENIFTEMSKTINAEKEKRSAPGATAHGSSA